MGRRKCARLEAGDLVEERVLLLSLRGSSTLRVRLHRRIRRTVGPGAGLHP